MDGMDRTPLIVYINLCCQHDKFNRKHPLFSFSSIFENKARNVSSRESCLHFRVVYTITQPEENQQTLERFSQTLKLG